MYKIKYTLKTGRHEIETYTTVYGLSKDDAVQKFEQFALLTIYPIYDYEVTGAIEIDTDLYNVEQLHKHYVEQNKYITNLMIKDEK